MEKITVAGTNRILNPNNVKENIVLFNPNALNNFVIKLAMIKWNIIYNDVLSNPRLELLNPFFAEYELSTKISELSLDSLKSEITNQIIWHIDWNIKDAMIGYNPVFYEAEIILTAYSKNTAPVLPFYIPVATLNFDRQLNTYPVGWGCSSNSIVSDLSVDFQMSL